MYDLISADLETYVTMAVLVGFCLGVVLGFCVFQLLNKAEG